MCIGKLGRSRKVDDDKVVAIVGIIGLLSFIGFLAFLAVRTPSYVSPSYIPVSNITSSELREAKGVIYELRRKE